MLSVKDLGVVSGKGAHVTHAAMSRRHGLCIWAMDRIGLGTYLRLRAFRRITDEIGTAERGYEPREPPYSMCEDSWPCERCLAGPVFPCFCLQEGVDLPPVLALHRCPISPPPRPLYRLP